MRKVRSIGIVTIESNDGKGKLGYIVLVDGARIGPVYSSLADAIIALVNLTEELGLNDVGLRKIQNYVNNKINNPERKNERVHQSSCEPT
jgi:hypothetical protein